MLLSRHVEDVRMPLEVLHRLVERGNTVLAIEHDAAIIKTADWIIGLGPEGGAQGRGSRRRGPPTSQARGRRARTGTRVPSPCRTTATRARPCIGR
ncbi:MAG TPA: hypothetical protein VHG08_05040, partial [Longimicrobium sp.]|nr:hypothetical protein [Longimicrobium sp.]